MQWMVGKPKVINLMSLSHSLVEWWVVRQDYRGRGGAEINKLSWWKQQNISKRAPLALWPGLPWPCWCKNLITQTFNSAEVIMKIAKRNGKENSKYWHYWKWHPPFKFSKVIVWFRPSSIFATVLSQELPVSDCSKWSWIFDSSCFYLS